MECPLITLNILIFQGIFILCVHLCSPFSCRYCVQHLFGCRGLKFNVIGILGKKLPELILPCMHRLQLVRDFLSDVDPTVKHYVTPITDMYGPTKDDPNIQVIKLQEIREKGP